MPRPCVISSTFSLSASVFLLCFPSPPYTSVSLRKEKNAKPALKALMLTPHLPTTKFTPSLRASFKPADTLTCTRLHWTNVCSGAAEQEKQLRSCPSPSLHFWGWGESRTVAAVVLGFFIFRLFSTLYHDSCLFPPPSLTEQRQE